MFRAAKGDVMGDGAMGDLTRSYFDLHPGVLLEPAAGGLIGQSFLVRHRGDPKCIEAALYSFPDAALSGEIQKNGTTAFRSLLWMACEEKAKDAAIMNNVLAAIIRIW
jgi:hypothetical protein